MTQNAQLDPHHNCNICPRLRNFILKAREANPDWHNGPVKTFLPPEGASSVKLMIIGLAPGMRGANRTARPFTGDYAGDLLYATLDKFDFSYGKFTADPNDGLTLKETAITNSVRCVPPENKPIGSEIGNCRTFLINTMDAMTNLKAVITLGKVAHDSTIRALKGRVAAHPFGHQKETEINGLRIFSSYHCSRYNTNTGRLTEEMFENVFKDARDFLDTQS